MPKTDVYILGQKYSIKGDASPEHIKELAESINERIEEVRAKIPNIAPTQTLILTLFNLAEDIHKLKTDQEDLTRDITEKAEILVSLFE